jgi:hypothetical protein
MPKIPSHIDPIMRRGSLLRSPKLRPHLPTLLLSLPRIHPQLLYNTAHPRHFLLLLSGHFEHAHALMREPLGLMPILRGHDYGELLLRADHTLIDDELEQHFYEGFVLQPQLLHYGREFVEGVLRTGGDGAGAAGQQLHEALRHPFQGLVVHVVVQQLHQQFLIEAVIEPPEKTEFRKARYTRWGYSASARLYFQAATRTASRCPARSAADGTGSTESALTPCSGAT